MKMTAFYLGISLVFSSQIHSEETLKEPQASSSTQDSLIDIGIQMHDEKKYDDAIHAYQTVLKENPSNIIALYEISVSLFAKKNYTESIKYSMEGIHYKSKHLPGFYIILGSAFDNLGESDKAIDIYRQGSILAPEQYLFPYNLGFTFFNKKNYDSARGEFQKALKLNPNHTSSILALANCYQKMHKPIPRLFSLSRLLILEPNSNRSKVVLNQLQEVLSQSISIKDSNPQEINITVTPDSDAVDGYMTVLDMSLAMTQAARYTDEGKGKTDIQWTVHAFESFFQIMLELAEKESFPGFCWNYFAPYYIEMQQRELMEPFVYLIFQSSENEEVKNWIQSNMGKVKEFYSWNKSYRW